jgi:hypothetical protein
VVAVCGLTARNSKELVDTIIPENMGCGLKAEGLQTLDLDQNLKTIPKKFQPIKN